MMWSRGDDAGCGFLDDLCDGLAGAKLGLGRQALEKEEDGLDELRKALGKPGEAREGADEGARGIRKHARGCWGLVGKLLEAGKDVAGNAEALWQGVLWNEGARELHGKDDLLLVGLDQELGDKLEADVWKECAGVSPSPLPQEKKKRRNARMDGIPDVVIGTSSTA